MLKLINEKNEGHVSDKYKNLHNQIREICPLLKDVEDEVIQKLMKITYNTTGITYDRMQAEDVADLVDGYNTLGEFILDWYDQLTIQDIIKFSKYDKKFIKSVFALARAYGYLNKDNYEIISFNIGNIQDINSDNVELGRKLSEDNPKDLGELLYWLLKYGNEYSVNKLDDLDTDTDLDMLTNSDIGINEVTLDPDSLAKSVEELEKFYKRIHEDLEEVNDQIEEQTVVEDPEKVDFENDPFYKKGVQETLKTLMQQLWEVNSNISSILTTISIDCDETEKINSINDILNNILDDTTINIGMLNKVNSLLNEKESDLLVKGEDKAEEIISK